MEDRVYNRWSVLQRELWNSEAVIKNPKEESEREEDVFFNTRLPSGFYIELNYSQGFPCSKTN